MTPAVSEETPMARPDPILGRAIHHLRNHDIYTHQTYRDVANELEVWVKKYRTVLSAALPQPVGVDASDWRDDPSSDERWNAGCDFAMEQLCAAMQVDPKSFAWDAATETLDGDVQAIIWRILRIRMGEDWSPDRRATTAAQPSSAAPSQPQGELREAGEALATQLAAVIDRLDGQAYSSTLSALNAFRAALAGRAAG